jgi:hypothetical protein
MFVKGSRYETVEDHELTDEQGRILRYKKIRFTPETDAQFSHLLSQGERLDHLAHRYYRDPERFWRICDANGTMWPEDLVATAGRRILIPL